MDSVARSEMTIALTSPQAVAQTTALLHRPAELTGAVIVLAHGAGTDMRHQAMTRHAEGLTARGHAVALFNFAYTEAGRRGPDPAPRLESAWADVCGPLHEALGPDRPLVIGGRSMGGRIATMVAAERAAELAIAGTVGIAYPLHPPGRPETLRVAHWPRLTVPTLLVCGDRDAMAPVDTLREQVTEVMPPGVATLHLIPGADHSFRVRKADGRTPEEPFKESADAIDAWIRDQVLG